MKTGLKIIKLFIEDKKPKTIREMAKRIRADYRITHTATQRLIAQNILKAETVGKSTVCQLNPSYYGKEIYEAEYERKERMLHHNNINLLCKEIMSKIGTSSFILLLFGSYAHNKQTKFSDLDLLFISNEKHFEDKISEILALLPLKTQVLAFTEEEFIRMKDAKKSNVVQEALERNIILYGIEAYYRIKNA